MRAVTHAVFDPGLESITVAETELSDVDGELPTPKRYGSSGNRWSTRASLPRG
jgi:hypothetical protein